MYCRMSQHDKHDLPRKAAIRLCRDHPTFCDLVQDRRDAADALAYWHAAKTAEAEERVKEFEALIHELDLEINTMLQNLVAGSAVNQEGTLRGSESADKACRRTEGVEQ